MNRRCQQLIFDNAHWTQQIDKMHQCPCIHGDLTEILPLNSFNPNGSFKQRAKQINKAKLRMKQHCFTHSQKCNIFGKFARQADLDISGLPCPDFSKAGKGKKREGKTSSVFACHAKFHAAWQTPLLIIENVPDRFPASSTMFWLIPSSNKEIRK